MQTIKTIEQLGNKLYANENLRDLSIRCVSGEYLVLHKAYKSGKVIIKWACIYVLHSGPVSVVPTFTVYMLRSMISTVWSMILIIYIYIKFCRDHHVVWIGKASELGFNDPAASYSYNIAGDTGVATEILVVLYCTYCILTPRTACYHKWLCVYTEHEPKHLITIKYLIKDTPISKT